MIFAFPRSYVWFLGAALSIIVCAVLIVQSQAFMTDPYWLSLGITADLTLGIPLLYYFLIVRKQSVNWITTLIVFLVAVGIAHWILPSDHRYFLGFVAKTLIITEAIVLLYGISQVRRIVAAYRTSARKSPDVMKNLQHSFTQVLGQHKGTTLAVSEIAMFYYGLFFWRARREVRSHQTAFTYHRASAYPALIGALLLVTMVETIAVHLLLSRWSEGLALGFTLLSAYSFLFLWADLVSVLKRPIVLEDKQLHLRIGLRWQADIPLHLIEAIQPIPDTFAKSKSTLNLALITSPNVLLSFKEPVVIQGLYGMKKTATRLALPMDEVAAFEQAILDRKNEPCC